MPATLATRRAKAAAVDADRLADGWRQRAASLGFDQTALAGVLGRAAPRPFDPHTCSAIEAELGGPDGLTRQRATFGRRDVLRAICERIPAGASVTAGQLERAADAFLGSDRVVRLLDRREDGQSALRLRDGRAVPVALGERRYSTPDPLAAEQRLVDRVHRDRGDSPPRSFAAVEAALAARPALSVEQQAMVREVCRRDTEVAVVAGRAGTGKTFALAAGREAWEAGGAPVRGAAVARRAAPERQDGAGIPSTSVAALLAAGRLPPGVLLVIDEAGMVGTRQLAAIVERVREAGGKLVLVGDHRQLPEIEAGGAFRGLVQRGIAVELRENRRQRHAWERTALDHLRDGRADEAVALYRREGRLVVERETADARRRLVADWLKYDGLMIAAQRSDVAILNRLARDALRSSGYLSSPEIEMPGGRFSLGDRVVVRRNDRHSGLANGDRAVVSGVDVDACKIELDCRGRRVTVGPAFLSRPPPTVTRRGSTAMRSPVHVAQGGTVDRTYTLGHELSREAGYTALSRGRDANHLYVANEPPAREEFAPAEQVRPDAVERLVSDLQRALLSRWRSTFTMTAGLGGWTNDSARSTQRREAMLWRGRRPAWEFLSGHSRTTSGSTGERLTPPRAHDRRPVAELLQMRRSTLEDYARRGLLLSLKPGRHRRFVRSDVEAALGRLRADGASGD